MSDRHDLLVRYNGRSNCVEFYSATSASEGWVQDFPRPHFTMELERLIDLSPDEAERRIGASVLSFLDFYSGARMRVRDYQEIGKVFSPSEQLKGPGEAEFELAMRHIDSCLLSRLPQDLEAAERCLLAAVAEGNADAKQFLASEWPRTKALALRRMADRE